MNDIRCIDCKALKITGIQLCTEAQPTEIGYCETRKAYVEIERTLEEHPCKDFQKEEKIQCDICGGCGYLIGATADPAGFIDEQECWQCKGIGVIK